MKYLAFFLCLVFIGCSKDELSCEESDIIGSWLITNGCQLVDGDPVDCTTLTYSPCENEPSDGHYYIFEANGTYRNNFATCNGSNIYNCTDFDSGTWELNGNNIQIEINQEFDCNSGGFTDISHSILMTIVSCTGNEFVVNDESDPDDKIQATFTRQ